MNAPLHDVVDVPVAALRPWPENPRSIGEAERAALIKAMRHAPEHLRARPLIALPDGTVIAGNQRLLAAPDVPLETLPTFYVDLDQQTAREWALRDNNGFGAWELDPLADMLRELQDQGSDLLALGFDQGELDRLLDLAAGDPEDGGETPAGEPPAEPTTKLGDLILMGRHQLLCGDSSIPHHLDLVFGGSEGCVLTDPPYGIRLDTDYRGMAGKGNTYRPVHGDEEPFDAGLLAAAFDHVPEQFWFGANYYRRTLPGSDLDGSWLVWDKRLTESADLAFGSGFELIWSRTPHKQDILRHLHFSCYGSEARDRQHPTQKPTALLREILDRWAPAGCIVADPFLGSGSTLLACEDTGRACHGIEIDPGYCDVIVARWEAHTGQQATRP